MEAPQHQTADAVAGRVHVEEQLPHCKPGGGCVAAGEGWV